MKTFKCDSCGKEMKTPEITYPNPKGHDYCKECFYGGKT